MANADVFKSMSQKPGMSSEDIYGKVSTAPSQTVTGAVQPGAGGPGGSTTTTGAFQAAPAASAPAEPAEVGRFAGSGNYEYATMSDGSIKITKSTRGGAGTIVAPDSEFYDLIVADIEKFSKPASKPANKPAAPKATAAAPKGANITSEGFAPSRETSTETSEEIADRLLSSMDGVERGEPAPKFGGMGEVRRSETEAVPSMSKFEPPASMVGPSEYDKRKELSSYGDSIGGSVKLAGLADDARAGLVKTKMDPKGADATVRQLMKQMREGDYKSFEALKSFAAM